MWAEPPRHTLMDSRSPLSKHTLPEDQRGFDVFTLRAIVRLWVNKSKYELVNSYDLNFNGSFQFNQIQFRFIYVALLTRHSQKPEEPDTSSRYCWEVGL